MIFNKDVSAVYAFDTEHSRRGVHEVSGKQQRRTNKTDSC